MHYYSTLIQKFNVGGLYLQTWMALKYVIINLLYSNKYIKPGNTAQRKVMVPKQKTANENESYLTIGGGGNIETGGGTV